MPDTSDKSKVWDWMFKIMSSLVIPLVIWGVKLEVRNAVQDEKINELQKDLDDLSSVEEEVQTISTAQGRLEEKINGARDDLKDIKELLRKP